MSTAELVQILKQQGIATQENVKLAPYTSFHIGGPCRLLVSQIALQRRSVQ